MHRAARSATADHVRALLQHLLFVHRAKLVATRLQYQLEETIDDLDDIGFDEQVLKRSITNRTPGNKWIYSPL